MTSLSCHVVDGSHLCPIITSLPHHLSYAMRSSYHETLFHIGCLENVPGQEDMRGAISNGFMSLLHLWDSWIKHIPDCQITPYLSFCTHDLSGTGYTISKFDSQDVKRKKILEGILFQLNLVDTVNILNKISRATESTWRYKFELK